MSTPQIVLAEDDPSVLKITKLRLEYEGFKVITATNGEEAVQQVEAHHDVDVVLMDIKMPKLNGFEVCQRLKANPETAKIPIIVFTASSIRWQSLVDKCIEVGVTDWLRKPFRTHELLEKLHHAIGTPHGGPDEHTTPAR